jgi:transglutaminase-like putative cysteine protease
MVARKLLYLLAFFGLAVTAALAVDRVGSPSLAPLLLLAVVVGTAAGGLGLVRRRAWPLSLALIPLGAFLLFRLQFSPPPTVHGVWQQLGSFRVQLDAGGRAYVTEHLPFDFDAAPELRLLLSFVVYGAVAVAALSALSLRKALPAVVVLLVLLGFGVTIDSADRVILLPAAFLLLAGCLLMLSRSLERERWKPVDSLAGVATTVIASLLGLSLLGATSAAASQPWQDWRTWGGTVVTHESTSIAFSGIRDYPGLLDPKNDAEVMRVKSPVASYWRANALDYFTGSEWSGDKTLQALLTPEPASGLYRYSIPNAGLEPPGRLVTEGFRIGALYTDYYFTGGTPRTLVLRGRGLVQLNGAQALRAQGFVGPHFSYEVTAVVPQLKPADLVARGRDYPSEVLPDSELPFPTQADLGVGATESQWRRALGVTQAEREWLPLYRLNRTIVGRATDPYDIALRVEEYLRRNYRYSLSPPSASLESPYAAFLFETKTGFCQHFAGAMAVLMRFNGIPSRVVLGFATGHRAKDGTFIVSRTDAHAWVEVYFPLVGWVPFDPTPGHSMPGQGTSSTSPGFVSPFTREGAAVRDPSATATKSAAQRLRDRLAAGGGGRGTVSERSPARRGLPWAVALAGLLLAWPLGRTLLRRRGLHGGDPECRLRASLALMYAELKDFGIDVPRSQTLEETSRLLKERVGLDATGAVDRVQAVLFGGRSVTGQDLADVTELRRELRRKLRAREGLVRGLLALYGVPATSAGRG